MLFLDYEKSKIAYHAIQIQYNDLLAERESLFTMTQPKSIRYDNEKVSGGKHEDTFAEYLIKKEQLKLDERIEESRVLMDARAEMMDLRLIELKSSKDTLDKVYWHRFILRERVSDIATKLNYSEPQIYRFLRTIRDTVTTLYYM